MFSKHVKEMALTFTILFFLPPIQAQAGMAEIFSIYEAIMPPAVLWIGFVVIWYLTVALAATRHGDAIGGVPPLPKAIGILLVTAILSLTMVGPAAILYLLLFFPVVTFKAFFTSPKAPIKDGAAVMLRRISIVSTLVLAGLITTSAYIHSQRSKAEFQQLLHPARTSGQIFEKRLS